MNKKQWFMLLQDMGKIASQYEKNVLKFKNITILKLDIDRPIRTGFYKEVGAVIGALGSLTRKKMIKAFLIMPLIAFITSFIIKIILTTINNDPLNFSKIISFAILTTVITLIAIVGLTFGVNILRLKSIIHKLEKDEKRLLDNIATVPPSYRSSDKMNALADVYYARQDLSLKSIFEVCDEWFAEDSTRSKFHSIMFDITYTPVFQDEVMTKVGTTDESGSNTQRVKNLYLPADIENKVFSGSDNAEKDLNNMIGLTDVKDQIKKLENRIKFYGKSDNNGNHMAFVGSAGTGKTSVARIITKILFDLGYIKENRYIEISGDYLKSGSSERTSAILDYSMGGVLFIDEAYLLYDRYDKGTEATGLLLKSMEDRRADFVVILAGYEEQMTKLIASNEGFSSRIKHTIYFSDYNIDEMLNIFEYFISNYNNNHYRVAEEAVDSLKTLFSAETKSRSFGNARTVRNAVDGIMDYFADRNINAKIQSNVILAEDVLHYYEDRKKFLQHEMQNSSAADHLDEQIIRLSELKSKLKLGSENPDDELTNLIGMEDLIDEFGWLKNQKEFYNDTQHQKIALIGKSTYSRDSVLSIITGELYKLGYIAENKYLDISADFMKGSYVGHTSKRADAIISYVSGGVLAISDINMINTQAENQDNFSQEVINIILTALKENPNITIIILDDYSDFLNSILPQFTFVYEFPEYNAEQYYQLFIQYAKADNFEIDDRAKDKILSLIANIKNTDALNNFYNTVKKNHISHFNGVDNKYLITLEDISVNKTIRVKLNRR